MLKRELRPMLALAGPVVLAELGWIGMGIVDTIMVGRLGPAAIGGVGLSSTLFQALAIFGMGLLLGLDTLVSHAFGAGRIEECHRWLLQGVYLSLILTPPMAALGWLGIRSLGLWGFEPTVLAIAVPYLKAVIWSLLPLLLYATFRRYLQAMGIVKPVTLALITANVVNAIGNWVLVFGHLGAPELGTTGSAWATVASRAYMAAFLLAVIVYHDVRHRVRLRHVPWHFDLPRIRRLVSLGAPAAMQVTLELGVFAAAGALAGRLEAVSLAAHQIALNLASVTFMVPLGIASAGAVRVGHAIGRRDPGAARAAGWTALALGVGFMSVAAAAFLVVPVPLLRLFSHDPSVLALGTSLLAVAAMFQLFDGLQGVATGVLRGAGDTRTPMLSNLFSHWFFGLPVGYVLCFVVGWGVIGLWIGLSAGLIAVGIVLLAVWQRRSRQFVFPALPAPAPQPHG